MNTPEQEQVLLQKLNEAFVKIKTIQKNNPNEFKQWVAKKGKTTWKDLQFVAKCLQTIQANPNTSAKKKEKLEDKIEVLGDKAIARGVNLDVDAPEEDGEDEIKWKEFKDVVDTCLSVTNVDKIFGKLETPNNESVNIGQLISFANKEPFTTPLGTSLTIDLVRALNGKTKVFEIKEAFIFVIGNILKPKNLKAHYTNNKSAYNTDNNGKPLYKLNVSTDITTFLGIIKYTDKLENDEFTAEQYAEYVKGLVVVMRVACFSYNDDTFQDTLINTKLLSDQLLSFWNKDKSGVVLGTRVGRALTGLGATAPMKDVLKTLSEVFINFENATEEIRSYCNLDLYKSRSDMSDFLRSQNIIVCVLGAMDKSEITNSPDYPDFTKTLKDSITAFQAGLNDNDSTRVVETRWKENLNAMIYGKNTHISSYILNHLLDIKFPSQATASKVLGLISKQATALNADEKLYPIWKKGELQFPTASHFVELLGKTKIQVNENTFVSEFEKWQTKIEGAVGQIAEKVRWTYDKTKLLSNIEAMFYTEEYGYKNIGSFAYEKLEIGLNSAGDKIKDTELAKLWKAMFTACPDSYLKASYNAFEKETTNWGQLENMVTVLDSILPDKNDLWIALANSRAISKGKKTPKTPKTVETMIAYVELIPKDTSLKGKIGITLNTTLELKSYPVGKNYEDMWQAIAKNVTVLPSGEGILVNACKLVGEPTIGQAILNPDYKSVSYPISLVIMVSNKKTQNESKTVVGSKHTIGGSGGGTFGGGPAKGNVGGSYAYTFASENKTNGQSQITGFEFPIFITFLAKSEAFEYGKNVDVQIYDVNFGDVNGKINNDKGFKFSLFKAKPGERIELVTE